MVRVGQTEKHLTYTQAAQQDILGEHLKIRLILQWTLTVTLISCVKCDISAGSWLGQGVVRPQSG